MSFTQGEGYTLTHARKFKADFQLNSPKSGQLVLELITTLWWAEI